MNRIGFQINNEDDENIYEVFDKYVDSKVGLYDMRNRRPSELSVEPQLLPHLKSDKKRSIII